MRKKKKQNYNETENYIFKKSFIKIPLHIYIDQN